MFAVIIYRNTIVDGARHLFNEIELVREFFHKRKKKVSFKAIQDNAWLANPGNIILAMCGE